MIEWSEGQWVETLVSQYMAYIDGRIEEVALDHYAQADDGSVWYLGEDVFDYSNTKGLIDGTAGTWLAGRDGPLEMIMPADPQVGDVHRAENIPGIAFEEVTIKRINKTVDGPTGPVEGAMIARELHDDGTYSDKVFAPGYGEFFSGHGSEIEAMALAVPTDALDGPVPPELEALSAAANDLLDPAMSGDWSSAAAAEKAVDAGLGSLPAGRGSTPARRRDGPRAEGAGRCDRRPRSRRRRAPRRSTSPSRRSTSSCATGRRPRSTSPASSCGRARSWFTGPPATWAA